VAAAPRVEELALPPQAAPHFRHHRLRRADLHGGHYNSNKPINQFQNKFIGILIEFFKGVSQGSH